MPLGLAFDDLKQIPQGFVQGGECWYLELTDALLDVLFCHVIATSVPLVIERHTLISKIPILLGLVIYTETESCPSVVLARLLPCSMQHMIILQLFHFFLCLSMLSKMLRIVFCGLLFPMTISMVTAVVRVQFHQFVTIKLWDKGKTRP